MTKYAIFPAMVALAMGVASGVQAQNAATTPGAPAVSGTSSATNNAVSTGPANNGGAPVPGANSFTESQARSRLEDKGFTQITNLALDSQGIWRGKGTKNGQSVDVSLDYQGNVVPQ